MSSNKADIDLEKHLALLSLMLVMFIQEALWFATKDDVHLALLTLEAAVASIMLRLLFRKLDPNLPALPLHHFVSISTYNVASALLVLQYFKDIFKLGLGDPVQILWGVLLAVLLFVPLLEVIISSRQDK